MLSLFLKRISSHSLLRRVELGRFKAHFGADACEVYKEAVNKLENMGWLTVDQRFMRLTDRGLDMQNSALMEFMQ